MSETADRLAAAALAILVNEGAQAVTMRRVAADVGLTAMATYRHFPNREALLRAAVDMGVAKATENWASADADLGFEDRFALALTEFLDFALHQPNLYAFLVSERWPGARRFPDDFITGGSPAFAPVFAAVQDAMKDGKLRQDDPLEVTLALAMPVTGLVQQYLGGRITLPEPEFRALCTRTVGRVLNGLQT
ncbi:TetR/AcrR family transcriptional regulator [Actinocrispum sp. NPDC049592]|uniref:TetR/AcrR family transcriptional regulator n=1 Tax=Actinocrispum sp. NPDC049592 TaxID=3154835 RepID=UPI003424499C